MKFIIKLFVLFVFIKSLSVYSQHMRVEYEKYNLKDLDYNISLSKEYQDKVSAERKKAQKYFLYYSDGYSFFKSIPRSPITHNAGDKKENDVQTHKREIYKENELKMYHNKNENGNYSYHNFKDTNEEFYGYKDTKFAKVEYKDDTMNIDNYVCKLVEVSFDNIKKYKVWYTEGIPVSAGPFSFNNFPGLVLRVEAESYIITAVKISNDAKQSDIEKINPKINVYKNEEYDKKLKDINEQRSKPTFEEIKL